MAKADPSLAPARFYLSLTDINKQYFAVSWFITVHMVDAYVLICQTLLSTIWAHPSRHVESWNPFASRFSGQNLRLLGKLKPISRMFKFPPIFLACLSCITGPHFMWNKFSNSSSVLPTFSFSILNHCQYHAKLQFLLKHIMLTLSFCEYTLVYHHLEKSNIYIIYNIELFLGIN
jgi:hypothetical protein